MVTSNQNILQTLPHHLGRSPKVRSPIAHDARALPAASPRVPASTRASHRTATRRAHDRAPPTTSPLEHKKKMIILHKGPAEHRDAWTSAPRGEPGTPPSVLTPQSPCTIERAVSVGTLYRDTIYASAATTNESCRSSHQMMYSPVHTVGGSSLPSGWERILGQGHFHPPEPRMGDSCDNKSLTRV